MTITRRAALALPVLATPAALGGLAVGAAALPARAQERFPSRPIRLVVGFPPGGGSDLVARPIAQRMGELLGQAVTVENRGGANGNLGLDAVAKAPADGYTFGHVNNAVIGVNPLLYRNLPFDPVRDFEALAAVTVGGLFLMVPAALPVRTLAEFIALAKAQPGRMNFASAGPGSITHLAFELFRRQAGVELEVVHYRGSAPALQDMLGGRAQLMIDGINLAKAQVDSGAVRALAFLNAERHPLMPAVPTAREQGMKALVIPGWQGFVLRAGTPAPVAEALEAAVRSALADPGVQATFNSQAIITRFAGRAEFARMIREETERWRPIVREMGLSLD